MAESTKPRRLGRGLSSLMSHPPVRVEVGEEERRTTNIERTTSAIASGGDALVASDHTHQPERREGAGAPGSSGDAPGRAAVSSQGPGEGAVGDLGERIVMVAVGEVSPNPFQPRTEIAEEALAQLAASIREQGVMQPIVVRRGSGDAPYEIVAGERRWRAAMLAGLRSVPALVRELSDEQSAEWALVENVQREDLNAMERAWALRTLCEKFGLTQAQAGDKVAIDRSSVANLIRLTELERDVQRLISSGDLTPGHGKALLVSQPGSVRGAFARRAAQERWTVRRLEQEIARTARGPKKPMEAPAAAALADMEERLGKHLGTKVRISTNAGATKGRIAISFYNLPHFDDVLTRMGFKGE